MIKIGQTLVSDDIIDECFICDVPVCCGACCVEGDAGAPLEEEEISILEDYLDRIKPFMTKEGIDRINYIGVFEYDQDGNYATSLINDRDCAFVYHENGIAKCAIEKAFDEGIIPFQKPISCHLYPIRITSHDMFDAVNYHQWEICEPARILGKKKKVRVYEFLKEPLIRKYGEAWYQQLELIVAKEPL